MPRYKELCAGVDVPPGKMKGFKVGDLDVLVANVEGTFYAVEGTCPHMSGYRQREGSRERIWCVRSTVRGMT
jgi:nitrite reductase/ring-hydroxylating ferredoxin subunit